MTNYRDAIEKNSRVKRISFLKIPKTGSSTVACVFLRFGINNNLSMYLPIKPEVSDTAQDLLLKQNKQYDIFLIHTNYSHKFFTNIVRNPAIIGNLRRPEDRIISHAFFFNLKNKHRHLQLLSRQEFINEVVKDPARYGVNAVITLYFGIKDLKISETDLQQYLTRLNSEFTLVLILERLDESLVLLKRLLGWSVFDIIYAAKKTSSKHSDIHLNSNQIGHLQSTNKLEYVIYDFFYKELERKIQNAGDNFTEEVAHFKNILNQTETFCSTPNNTMPFYTFPASSWDDSFSLTTTDCYFIYNKDVVDYKKIFYPSLKERN